MASLIAAAVAACGPVNSTALIDAAAAATARAHAEGGDVSAPYETTSADLYLEKAREQSGHAHYADAAALARASRDFANQAVQKAAAQRGEGGAPPRPAAPAPREPADAPAARPR
ncbi:MAG: hypothetical protein NVSMB23_14460 [Myxococcales bacterium]